MKPYPEYKESGVEWFATVPVGWEVVLARRIFRQSRTRAVEGDEQLSVTQSSGVLPQRLFMEQEDQKVVLALSGLDNFKHVEAGDFVISLRSFQGGIEYSAYSGCVSPAYTVLRKNFELVDEFFYHLLKSPAFISMLQSVTSGIRDGRNISYEQFGEIALPLPPLSEQRAIAGFLDREVAKIDALIEESRALIAALAEKRQATISHAVTRGLNPSARLKPSGVDWLGDIPEGWEVVKLSRAVSTIGSGTTPASNDARYYDGGEIPWINTGDLDDRMDIAASRCVTGLAIEHHSTLKIFPPISVIVALYGATIGKLGITAEAACVNQACCVIAGSDCISPEFLFYWLMAARPHIIALAYGGGQPNISQEIVRSLRIGLPPPREQLDVVDYLKGFTARLDALTEEASAAIALLQERRAALISAAVTGKIDTRDIVAAA